MTETEYEIFLRGLDGLDEEMKAEMVRHFRKIFKGREEFVIYLAEWAAKKDIVIVPIKEPPKDLPRVTMDMGGHGGLEYFMKTCEKTGEKMVLIFADRKGATLLGFIEAGALFVFDVLSGGI